MNNVLLWSLVTILKKEIHSSRIKHFVYGCNNKILKYSRPYFSEYPFILPALKKKLRL